MFSFNFPPRGWADCDGQLLPINQNQSLYSLLGTTYGGDGRTTFGLPDLRGRAPMHEGDGHDQGQKSGAEGVALSVSQIPQHTHALRASGDSATSSAAAGNVYARSGARVYKNEPVGTLVSMRAGAIADAGSNQAHNNMQPFLTIRFCIALQGLFPSRN
jgi:microcystin-dependent protein